MNFPPVCDDWSELTEKLVTRWAEVADKHHPVQDAEFMRSCDYVLMSVRWMHRRSLTEIDRDRMPNATESNAQRSIINPTRPSRRPAGLRQAA